MDVPSRSYRAGRALGALARRSPRGCFLVVALVVPIGLIIASAILTVEFSAWIP